MAEAVINDILFTAVAPTTEKNVVPVLNLNEFKLWCHQLQNFYLTYFIKSFTLLTIG